QRTIRSSPRAASNTCSQSKLPNQQSQGKPAPKKPQPIQSARPAEYRDQHVRASAEPEGAKNVLPHTNRRRQFRPRAPRRRSTRRAPCHAARIAAAAQRKSNTSASIRRGNKNKNRPSTRWRNTKLERN